MTPLYDVFVWNAEMAKIKGRGFGLSPSPILNGLIQKRHGNVNYGEFFLGIFVEGRLKTLAGFAVVDHVPIKRPERFISTN